MLKNDIYKKFFLTFKNPYVEKEFLEKNDFNHRYFFRTGLILLFFVWILIIFCGYTFFPDKAGKSILFIVFVILPYVLFVISMTFKKKFVKFFQPLSAIANCTFGILHIYFAFYISNNMSYALSVMILTILYAYFIFRLRFKIAVLTSAIYVSLYIAVLIIQKSSIDYSDFVIHFILIISSYIAIGTGGYVLERNSRDLFLFNRSLIKRNREVEQGLDLARNKIMQDRMTPHFLFNALNSIYYLIKNNKNDNACEAIFKLSDMYRYLIEFSDDVLVEFKDEWKIMETYLEIERLRFQDSLIIDLKQNGDFSKVKIPPLVLQPIVENSIKHSQVMLNENGSIEVHAIKDGKKIKIDIYDNGIGLQTEDLFSRSLGNIRSRLQFFYKDADVTIENQKKEGVQVTIIFYLE